MKIVTVFGTRPEIIRLCRILPLLDRHCEHVTVHTGQNYDPSLSDVFFADLGLRMPDVLLGIRSASFAEQTARILEGVDKVLEQHKPDRVLILGDTNSALSALVAARRGVKVFHLEAGNRCHDDRVPEEINRRVIDHCSTILLPYTHRSKENLLAEGIDRERIFVVGNPIGEVLAFYNDRITASQALQQHQVTPQGYFVVTLHRAENVDSPSRLNRLVTGLSAVGDAFKQPVLVSVHPRTASRLKQDDIHPASSWVRLLSPLGFFDFVGLERQARAVLTDSGTVQEECAILGVPNVTLRDVTERPETLECGSNLLAEASPEAMVRMVELALALPGRWRAPDEYLAADVSRTVIKILLGHCSLREHHGPSA